MRGLINEALVVAVSLLEVLSLAIGGSSNGLSRSSYATNLSGVLASDLEEDELFDTEWLEIVCGEWLLLPLTLLPPPTLVNFLGLNAINFDMLVLLLDTE